MATKRRSYFRVECQILRDGFTPEEGWLVINILGTMTDRWARDKLTPDEACHLYLNRTQLLSLCCRTRASRAQALLTRVAARVSMRVDVGVDGRVHIFWPNFAEKQGLRALANAPANTPANARSQGKRMPVSAPAPVPTPVLSSVCSSNKSVSGESGGSPEGGDPLADARSHAARILELYGRQVKPPSADSSRSRARKHLTRIATSNAKLVKLEAAVANYARWCKNSETPHAFRFNSGNFFGRDELWTEWVARTDARDGLDARRARTNGHHPEIRSATPSPAETRAYLAKLGAVGDDDA